MDKIGGDDLSKMIQTLMADEKFGEILSSVKESFSSKAENDPPDESSEETQVEPADISDTAVSVSAANSTNGFSPEIISKLPMIMSMLSGGDGADSKSNSHLADRKCLLRALKPFLSTQRRDAVDSILNVADIADLFGL